MTALRATLPTEVRAPSPDGRRIPVAGPWITEREIRYVTEAVEHAWYGNANEFHLRFESAFAEYVGRQFAIALPSCTSALHLALLAQGIGPGDEVAIADTTWIASAAPISYVGATPVFVDVDRESWCMDVESLERALTPRTRVAIVVDLYGNMPDYDALQALCDRHGVALIEDAAEAVGSTYRGVPAGGFGCASTFSFHGSKTLTTGEGGMLLTDDEETYRRCSFLRDHGRNPGDTTFRSVEVAYKYKMSSMQAALGLAQIERVDEILTRKREIFAWYREAFAETRLGRERLATLNADLEDVEPSYWMVTVILDPSLERTKDELIAALRESGVDARPFFDPLSSLTAFREVPGVADAAARNRNAYALAPYGVNLPSALSLTREDVEAVCRRLDACVGLG